VNIIPYTEEALAASLSNQYTTADLIKTKNHFNYLSNYFGTDGLNARTILIEEDYISKDFLHDYASYYALCFEKYPKVCRRVHFFDIEITEAEFASIILKPENKKKQADFWEHYVGFVVVKPIPGKIIGYTVLKTYPTNLPTPGRSFWGLREYTIHLFGNEIKFKSLAFQEQDSVLAACATTAIWSMLNKAAVDFHTILKSPSQITKDADNVSYDGSRLFPNRGLNVLQICQAIFNSGLVSEVKQANITVKVNKKDCNVVSNEYLKKIINAYSPIGIPIILVVKVPTGTTHGLHAITVSGFKADPLQAVSPDPDMIHFTSANIDRLYAHDDQWGPFARVNLKNNYELDTPWNEGDPTKPATLVTHIIVPVYPKIRIAYEDIEAVVLGLDQVLRFFFEKRIKKLKADLMWDIKIDYSENFKSQLKTSHLPNPKKVAILSKSMPKYLWVATCYIGETPLFSFTFDATNVNNAMLGVNVITFVDDSVKATLIEFINLNADVLTMLFKHMYSVDFLIKELT
jgi:hypothetical protein